jgi:hypothetical protein
MLKVVDFGFIEEKAGRWIRLTFNIELHTLWRQQFSKLLTGGTQSL